MKLSELMERFRIDADDMAAPYLWSDAFLKSCFNEAEQEACRRSALLKDSSTVQICRVTAAVENPWIALNPLIVKVLRAKPQGQGYPIGTTTADIMDSSCLNWEQATGTQLKALITDMETGKLRTYPIMTADVQIDLTVQRLPLNDMAKPDDCPEIRKESHIKLVHWVLYKAHMIPDIDANDPDKAQKELALFEAEFGKSTSASHDEFLRQNGGRDLFTGSFL